MEISQGKGYTWIVGGPWPAPAFIVIAAWILDIQTLARQVIVNPVPRVLLDVRIDNGHLWFRKFKHCLHSGSSYQLSALACQTISHSNAVWELSSVPREILLAISVLNVEPHHVHRDVMLVKLAVHCCHISLVIVVPPAQSHN